MLLYNIIYAAWYSCTKVGSGLGIYCIYIILINFIYLCIDILFKQLTFQGIELYK
jgi:hypothetical protein